MAKIEILIVDDSPAFNHLTRLTIQKASIDCNIIEVSNGQRALDYLSSASCPDVILLDINMPVMDGFDFLEEYARAYHQCFDKTLIYILTSSAQEVDKVKAKSFRQVKNYFEKPLTADNLNTIINDIGSRR
jgi:CheY-like chemotaxis protein